MWLIRGVFGHRKNFVKKWTEIHFSIFIENQNWDLRFIFQFDNENEKRKKLKFLFHFNTKIEFPFRPTDSFSIPILKWKLNSTFGAPINFYHASIFNFESKLKYIKISFFIPILKWKLNGTFGARFFDFQNKWILKFNFEVCF